MPSHPAIRLHQGGRPLYLEHVETRPPGPGEALVRLRYAALNHRDLWMRQGAYGNSGAPPCTLGSDGFGFVEAVGSGEDEAWVGRGVVLYPALAWGASDRAPDPAWRILGVPDAGTWAGAVTIPVSQLFDAPPGWKPEEAAALPLAGLTAHRALFRRGGLTAGPDLRAAAEPQRVLITGIGGGVAQFALQFARAAGAEAWVTSGSEDKLRAAKAAGARGGALYIAEGWGAALAREAGPFDLCVDSAGGAGWKEICAALKPGGALVYLGATRGPGEIPMRDAFFKQIDIRGTAMGSRGDFTKMLRFVTDNNIRPSIDSVFPLEDAEKALARMDAGEQTGKIVLKIS
jgi:NADPH:quinone reductase-like Zn-dependent oxidoreductase